MEKMSLKKPAKSLYLHHLYLLCIILYVHTNINRAVFMEITLGKCFTGKFY